jgi:integrase
MPLTDIAVKKIVSKEKQFRVADGKGLALLVHPNGSKYWQLRYRYGGKGKLLALGVYPEVSLAEARQKASEARLLLRNGEDPSAVRKQEQLARRINASNTFEAIATEWWENKREQWSAEHADRILGCIRKDLFPNLSSRPIADIQPPEILDAVRKVERRGALDVAGRELQFCKAIFRYAIQTGRARVNPASELTGALKSRKTQHRPSLKVGDLPAFYENLRESSSVPLTKLAIRLTILTFLRPGEIRTARWQDFDYEQKLWRIPAVLMKMKTEHLVPLSRQVLTLLDELRPLTGHHVLLFPGGNDRHVPISENTMNQCINRMGYQGLATPHGFRATASSLLNEEGFNRDAIERQLSHQERNKVRAAYTHHAEFMNERHRMMQWWADYLEKLETGNNVIPVSFAR